MAVEIWPHSPSLGLTRLDRRPERPYFGAVARFCDHCILASRCRWHYASNLLMIGTIDRGDFLSDSVPAQVLDGRVSFGQDCRSLFFAPEFVSSATCSC